jgi:hypothetical protein
MKEEKTFKGVLDKTMPRTPTNKLVRVEPVRKTTIEEIPDEEPVKHFEAPMLKIETKTTELLQCEEGDTLLAYYPGQPIFGIFKTETLNLSSEWDFPQGNIWICAKTSMSQELAHRESLGEPEQKKSLDELLPKHYGQYKCVFEKKASERFPPSRPWDHSIDLKPEFLPKDCKVYPLSPAGQIKLDEFLDKNLCKGYIQPSKSPMASLFFFVAKKDADAL